MATAYGQIMVAMPVSDCGGMVEDLGGAITMMNMAAPGTTRNFDCIWLLRPSSSYTFETHISVRVAQFEEMGVHPFSVPFEISYLSTPPLPQILTPTLFPKNRCASTTCYSILLRGIQLILVSR